MKITAVIPARYGSTRFPGKPLADLRGKPLIQWVYEGVKKAKRVDRVVVATDDRRILTAVRDFGGEAIITSWRHRSGTDRVAQVAEGLRSGIIVNVQGDEPMINPRMIDEAVLPLQKDRTIKMATLKSRLKDLHELIDPNIVKVVTDSHDFALYFSRSPIPGLKEGTYLSRHLRSINIYKHIGIYVYRRNFLLKLTKLKPTTLEMAEGLEQLRALEHGYRIKVITTRSEVVGVDTPGDLERAEKRLKADRK
ncbi:MAG: 3-deoxy-manno-octulosonate cytidylyltransferase [Deltaproteobacteria bacterium]|nr:MAG: 3-deoxy-manno-octulosonate cytidylyltransferase [Deltaproteobacteria bacterium]